MEEVNKSTEFENIDKKLHISDIMCSFIKDNLSIGLNINDTSVTVKLFLKDEIISECTESMIIYKRDIEGLD